MTSNKNRFSITVDDNLYKKIEDFRFARRLKSQSKAVNELMLLGIASLIDKEIKLEPDLNALDKHGQEIVSFVLQKEYERSVSSLDPSDQHASDVLKNINDSKIKSAL